MLLSFKDYSRASGLFTVEHAGRSHHLPKHSAAHMPRSGRQGASPPDPGPGLRTPGQGQHTASGGSLDQNPPVPCAPSPKPRAVFKCNKSRAFPSSLFFLFFSCLMPF